MIEEYQAALEFIILILAISESPIALLAAVIITIYFLLKDSSRRNG